MRADSMKEVLTRKREIRVSLNRLQMLITRKISKKKLVFGEGKARKLL